MIVGAGNTHASVIVADADEREWIEGFLSFKTKNFAKGRYYENTTCLLSSLGKFPAGFLPILRREAEACGVTLEVRESASRANPPPFDETTDLGWLSVHPFDKHGTITHQIEAVNAIREKRRGILWVPTGGGKTEIAAGLTKAIRGTWLFVVHRTQLAIQAKERFELRGIDPDEITIAADGDLDFSGRIVVATFQTLVSAIKKNDAATIEFLRTVQGLIVDEAHTLPADTFFGIVMRTVNAAYRIGLSGTPLARTDKRSLFTIAAIGPVIYRIKAETLIAAGLLSKPRVWFLRSSHAVEERAWRNIYSRHVVKGRERNALLVEAVLRAPKPSLLFVNHVEHGKMLVKALADAGVRSEFMWGEKNVHVRKAAIRRLQHGDIDTIVCSVVFQEGVDIPEIRSVVIGTGGKSAIAAIQRIGRGTRRAGGKDEVTIVDVYDEPCEGMESTEIDVHPGCRIFGKHTRERLRAYRAEGYEVTIGDIGSFAG